MNILKVRDTKILNFKTARPLLSTLFVRAARALLCPSSLELGGVGIYDSENRQFFRSEPNTNFIRARILRQSKANEYKIIDTKVGWKSNRPCALRSMAVRLVETDAKKNSLK
jgi:hypothetical protein